MPYSPLPAAGVTTLVLLFAAEAHAAIIADVLQPDGADAPLTFDPNNDNVGPGEMSGNFGSLDLTFTEASPLDVIYQAEDSDGVSEYELFGLLRNNTGRDWPGVRIELGFGSDESFEISELPQLDFDFPHQDSPVSLSIGGVSHDPETHAKTLLEWPAVPVLDGNAPTYGYHLDVPDADAGHIPTGAVTPDGYTFTVRYTPIPEPSSAALLALGALWLWRRPRRDQRLVNQVKSFGPAISA